MMGADASRVPIDRASLSLGKRLARTHVGSFEVNFFRDQTRDASVMAIGLGDLSDSRPLTARVHSSCVTSECLMARDCDCFEQLSGALERIADQRRGVVFYLIQEGRGAGLTAKARDRMMVQASGHRMTTFEAYAEMGLPPDLRRYEVLAPIARALRIRAPIELLSNNPVKVEAVSRVFAEEKIEVDRAVGIEGHASVFNRDYLRAKRSSGHALSGFSSDRGLPPPALVSVEPPMRSATHPSLISTAHYQLPVDLARRGLGASGGVGGAHTPDVEWFRIRVIYDERTAKESILLEFGDIDGRPPEVFCLGLMDRLPCAEANGREALRREMIEVRNRGRGRIVVLLDEVAPWTHLQAPGPARESAMLLAGEIAATSWQNGGESVSVPVPNVR